MPPETLMADLPAHPDDDRGVLHNRASTTPTPRRMYGYWVVGIALVLLFVVLHLTGVAGPGTH